MNLKFSLILLLLSLINCNKSLDNNKVKNSFTHISNIDTNVKQIPLIFEGLFESNEPKDCKISLQIFKKNGKLRYRIKTETQKIENDLSYDLTEDKKGYYLSLKNLHWSDYEGELNENGEQIKGDLEIPNSVPAYISIENKNEIIIQNTGNSLNYFVIFEECGSKYIHLIKK